jgi:hypothetical protein
MAAKKNDYEIGYAKPPKHTRFQSGKSGNPKGRTKGLANLKTDLTQELGELIRIREGDRERSISKQRAMIKALMARALKGDTRAIALLVALIAKHIEPDLANAAGPELTQNDQQILDDFLERFGCGQSDSSSKKGE